MFRILNLFLLAFLIVPFASADLDPGVISDFDNGTIQGWGPDSNLSNGSDFLTITPGAVFRPNLAAFNTGVAGTINPLVTSISVDMMRPSGEDDLDMRLVLFGVPSSERWTSNSPQTVLGDGIWRNYDFSIDVADLTRVSGVGSFASLTANLNRIMFRLDSGAPSAGGQPSTGSLNIDNVIANPVPLPAAGWLFFAALGCLASRGRRRLV